MRRIACLVSILHLAAGAAADTPASTVALTDVVVESREEGVRVEIKTSGSPRYRSELMDGPFRLVLDFENATYAWAKAPLAVGADPVKEIRGSQYRKGVARVVIELRRKAPYALEPHAGGLSVVFTGGPPATAPPKPARPAAAPPRAPVEASPFKLQGIVLRDEGAVAYIADTATNRVGAYRVGDRLGDAVVETIEERHIVLQTPQGAKEMRLEDTPPGARPRP